MSEENGNEIYTAGNGIATQIANQETHNSIRPIDMQAFLAGVYTSNSFTVTPAETVSSPTISKEDRMVRFKDAPWADKYYPIAIGGAGGIGATVSMLLSRLGHNLHIWDNDVVGPENVGVQMYSDAHIGKTKVEALKNMCYDFSGNSDIVGINKLFTAESEIQSICFSCFDNMEARKNMFNIWKLEALSNDGSTPCIFIDGRLLYGNMQIYIATKDTIKEYEDSLFDDGEVPAESCTLKITTHYAFGIASDMVSLFTNYLTNFILDTDILPLPIAYKKEMTSLTSDIIWKK